MSRLVLGLLVLCFVLFLAPSAEASRSANDFSGQMITGVGPDGSRIGIGTQEPAATLEVYHGEIKFGSSGAACSNELAGTLRSENSRLQFCDGASWRNVSLDKAE